MPTINLTTPRRAIVRAAAITLVVGATASLAIACDDSPSGPGNDGLNRQYGTPVQVGNGRARAYVVTKAAANGQVVELGVALDEQAMNGLRAPDMSHGEHMDHDMFFLPLPAANSSAFKLVELDWNPRGHGEPYTDPHFDFHFYTIAKAERDAMLPTDPQYAAKAAHDPATAAIPQFYANPAAAMGIPPEMAAVPQMGMHWVDVRSPELQGALGHPEAYQPFTKTFIYGAWDGQFIFLEPMITRAYIMAKKGAADAAVRDEVIPFPTSPAFPQTGFRPDAYRIAWDQQAKEYRIAVTVNPG